MPVGHYDRRCNDVGERSAMNGNSHDSTAPTAPPARRASRRVGLLLLLAASVALVVVVGLFWFDGGLRSAEPNVASAPFVGQSAAPSKSARAGSRPSAAPKRPAVNQNGPARKASVTYVVSGTGKATIEYVDPSRKKAVTLTGQSLPWRLTLPRQAVRFVLVTANRDSSSSGTRTGRILVDGEVVCSGTDQASYPVAGCSQVITPA
jgi:hypothetical protein